MIPCRRCNIFSAVTFVIIDVDEKILSNNEVCKILNIEFENTLSCKYGAIVISTLYCTLRTVKRFDDVATLPGTQKRDLFGVGRNGSEGDTGTAGNKKWMKSE
jgi:hypothetical protein